MEIVEQLRERLSRELSRLPSQFRLMLLSIGVGIVAGLGATTYSAVGIMVIMTTLLTPPLLKWTLADRKAAPGEGGSLKHGGNSVTWIPSVL